MRRVTHEYITIRNCLFVFCFISMVLVVISNQNNMVYGKTGEYDSMTLDQFKQFAIVGNDEEAYEVWNTLESKDGTLPIINELLKHPNPYTREIAIHCCSDFQPSVAMPLNAAALSDSSVGVRSTALGYLSSYHDKSIISALLENLANADSLIRSGVAEILGKVGDSSHLSYLGRQYEKEVDPYVKKKIALSMAKLGDENKKQKIEQQININDSKVRFQCLRDLQYIDDKSVAKNILPALDDFGNTYLISNMGETPEKYMRVCDLAINIIAKWYNNPFSFTVDNYTNYAESEIDEVKEFLSKLKD